MLQGLAETQLTQEENLCLALQLQIAPESHPADSLQVEADPKSSDPSQETMQKSLLKLKL